METQKINNYIITNNLKEFLRLLASGVKITNETIEIAKQSPNKEFIRHSIRYSTETYDDSNISIKDLEIGQQMVPSYYGDFENFVDNSHSKNYPPAVENPLPPSLMTITAQSPSVVLDERNI